MDKKKNLKQWGISLEDIPPEGITVEFSEIEDLGKEVKIKEAFSGYFKLKKMGIEVKLKGFLKGSVFLECDRCLSPFEYKIEHEFDLNIKPSASLNLEEERELTEEDMEVSFYEDSWISFLDLLKEEILLSLPYKKLCKEDCKGLCPVCGTNLNEKECTCKKPKKESPFAVLKELLQKKNSQQGG